MKHQRINKFYKNDFSVKMLIVAGLDHNALARTLETTLQQPGIQPDLVTVSHHWEYINWKKSLQELKL